MTSEIADSDAESDYEILPTPDAPTSTSKTTGNRNTPALDEPDRSFDVNFDDFISQSGNVSLRSPSQPEPSKQSAGSTQKLLRGIEDAQGALAGSSSTKTLSIIKTRTQLQSTESPSDISRKRRHTAVEDDDEAQRLSQSGDLKWKKRAKTYGNSRIHLSSSQSEMFGHEVAQNIDQHSPDGEKVSDTGLATEDIPTQLISTMLPPPPTHIEPEDDDDDAFIRQRNRPRRVTSLLNGHPSESKGEISTARSSMGGYESINIDFRNSVNGMDINANPFGSLSQISNDGDLDPAETEKLANLFPNRATVTRPLPEPLPGFEVDAENRLVQEYSVSDGLHVTPGRSRFIDPSVLMNDLPEDLPNDTQLLSSYTGSSARKRRKTVHAGAGLNESSSAVEPHTETMSRATEVSEENPTVPKKRGRKPKNQRLPSTSPAPMRSDAVELVPNEIAIRLPEEQYEPNLSRSRAKRVESTIRDHQATKSGKSQDKRKKSKFEDTESNPPTKQPSSEINLSDEAFIGLPKENYQPRPSRSRRGTTDSLGEEPQIGRSVNEKRRRRKGSFSETEQQENNEDQSSPMKNPTSELNLSDEVSIGLPKENYKPRPSLSRSTRHPNKEDTTTDQAQEQMPSKSEAQKDPRLPKRQEKKRTKAKVKRAKTSAAALLKRSDPMLSEGEEDVIYMDEKPAKVRLDLPPDMKMAHSVKYEDQRNAGKMQTGLERREEGVDNGDVDKKPANGPKAANTNFRIELPPRDGSKTTPPPEPKKRGRKPKKAVEVPTDEAVEEESAATKSPRPITRPALNDRDPNLHLNLTPHGPKQDSIVPIPSPQKENDTVADAIVTPRKAALASESSPTTRRSVKGPTKHSPINPPGAMAKYRVGLSRRAPIPSLLKIVRKDRPSLVAPTKKKGKAVAKGTDVGVEAEAEAEPVEPPAPDDEVRPDRDADGMGAMRRNPETGLLEEYVSD